MSRPSFENYFMNLAFMASVRSHDPTTKHGCVLVDKDNVIIGTGYNGFPASCNDAELPTERPAKYSRMVHAECNSVSNVSRRIERNDEVRAFVTGSACNECIRLLRINRVFTIYEAWRPGQSRPEGSAIYTDEYIEERESLIKQFDLNVIPMVPDLSFLKPLMDSLNRKGFIHTELEQFQSKLFNGHA